MNAQTVTPGDVTELLKAVQEGSEEAWEQLFKRVYNELRRVAERHRKSERNNHTLQTTALVNEAFLRLVRERERSWANRSHFFAIASTCMRRVLVRYAEERAAIKRGGGKRSIVLDDALLLFESRSEDLLHLDERLKALEKHDPRKSQIVEMRFFGGRDFKEIAAVLDLSVRTVERDWRVARAWLRSGLDDETKET